MEKNARLSYKILDKVKLNKSEIAEIEGRWNICSGDELHITGGYRCYIKVVTEGDSNKKLEYEEKYICKTDGKWYMFDL